MPTPLGGPAGPLLAPSSASTSQYSSLGAASPASDAAGSPLPGGPLLLGRKRRRLQSSTALHINLLTALWGPACFAMPWAFQEAGLLAGSVGVVLVAAFSFATLTLLIEAKRHFSGSSSSGFPRPAPATPGAGASPLPSIQEQQQMTTPPPTTLYGAVGGDGNGRNGNNGNNGNGMSKEAHAAVARAYEQAAAAAVAQQQPPHCLRAVRDGYEEELTYAQVAAKALGRPASSLVKVATTVSCLGACAAYMVFIAGMIAPLAPDWGERDILVAFLPLFILLSWVRGFRRLSFLNLLGNISLLMGLAAIFYDGLAHGHQRGISPLTDPAEGGGGADAIAWVNPSTLLLFFGPTAFLFVIHYCAVPIESEAADPGEFTGALGRSMALTALLDIVVGCAGYIFYGRAPLQRDAEGQVIPGCERAVCDNVLKNIEAGPVKTLISVTFAVNLVLTYEIMLIPPREYIERYLVRGHRVIPTKWQRNLTRAALVLATFLVASSVTQFGLLTGFVGSITDSLQGFVLPPLVYAATFRTSLPSRQKAGLLLMSTIGVVLMVTATTQNIGELRRVLFHKPTG